MYILYIYVLLLNVLGLVENVDVKEMVCSLLFKS